MSISKQRIGIIGGAGPMAGMLLYQKIIEICQKEHNCQHDADFPYIMLLSYPFADMLRDGITPEKRTLLASQIDECFSTFSQNGIQIIAIACNTLHLFLTPELMEKSLKFTFVHMIKEIRELLTEKNLKESLVLCSNTSANSRLHASHFTCSYPQEVLQHKCQAMIDLVLAGKESKEAVAEFTLELNHELLANAKRKMALVLGCTEFSVLNERFPFHAHGLSDQFSIIDSNEIVARKICNQIF